MGHNVHLYPSQAIQAIHPDFSDITIHCDLYNLEFVPKTNVKVVPVTPFWGNWGRLNNGLGKIMRFLANSIKKGRHIEGLRTVVNRLKPDVIHLHEIQHAGYLYSNAQIQKKSRVFLSVWGIDLHFFRFYPEHIARIRSLLTQVDHLLVEGKRDEQLARGLAYTGPISIIQSTGGIDLENSDLAWQSVESTALRRAICIKGEDNLVRRGLFPIMALHGIAKELEGYTIYIYSCSDSVKREIFQLMADTNLEIEIVPHITQNQLFEIFKKCQVSVIINSSDGVSNSLLETMLAGCIPVISNTSCAVDFFEDGINGVIVNHRSTESIAEGIIRSIKDEKLQQNAPELNRKTVIDNYSRKVITDKLEALYR
ncbi:MAG: glycosyltransferase family 4 protein [Flavobacteriales bacterium]|nr:glycosyltransferase family 4 protein [Flavobacteriales bacterium]